jgi:cation transport regulator ChaC
MLPLAPSPQATARARELLFPTSPAPAPATATAKGGKTGGAGAAGGATSPTAPPSPKVVEETLQRELGIPATEARLAVQTALQQQKGARWQGFTDTTAARTTTTATTPPGNAFASRVALMVGANKKQPAWDPIGRLPPALQARLSPADRAAIVATVAQLQEAVQKHKLDHVPVFGYLSLRTDNHRELGKKAQGDVVPGTDTLDATLSGYDLQVVASTVYRGTPERPGAVAGLGACEGQSTPGVVLKLPLERAEELLAVVVAREFFAEGDLKDTTGPKGELVSNSMYKPALLSVQTKDGQTQPALVFVTNDQGAKDMGQVFGSRDLTVGQLAWLFSAQGGFVGDDGKPKGGPSVDYWSQGYLAARKAAGQPISKKIAAAVERSKLMPQQDKVDEIMARTDKDAVLMQKALRVLFAGAAVSLDLVRKQQTSDGGGIARQPVGTRGDDAEARLLAEARRLQAAGQLDDAE